MASSDMGARLAPVRVSQNLLSLVGVLAGIPALSTRNRLVEVADMPCMEARLAGHHSAAGVCAPPTMLPSLGTQTWN